MPIKKTETSGYIVSFSHCKFGNFRENLIFATSVKRHIYDVKNSRLGNDLHDSSISRGFYFHETSHIRENKTLAKISEFTVFT